MILEIVTIGSSRVSALKVSQKNSDFFAVRMVTSTHLKENGHLKIVSATDFTQAL